MRGLTAQDVLVPELCAAYESLFESVHHPAIDPACQTCQTIAEGAFLRALRAWEQFIFTLLVQLAAGYVFNCQPQYSRRSTCIGATVTQAEALVLRVSFESSTGTVRLRANPGRYLLLHSPRMLFHVAEYFLRDSAVSHVTLTHQADIDRIVTIRHALAHGTKDAQLQLRRVLLHFEPLRVFSTPGEFLLTQPQAGGNLYIQQMLELLYGWATAMSP